MTATEGLRTYAQLRASIDSLFPDNTNEQIDAEDLRQWLLDAVRSIHGPHGFMGSNSPGTPMSIVFPDTNFKQIGSYGVSGSQDLTPDATAGTFTVPTGGDGTYCVEAYVTAAPPAACVLDFKVRKNGADTVIYGFGCTSLIAPFCVNWSGGGELYNVAAGDTITLWAKSSVAHTVPMHIQFKAARKPKT